VDGADVAAGPAPALRRRIGYVFQHIGLFPHMTVAENIAIGPRLAGDPPADVARLLDLVELPRDLTTRMPTELSGGQRQRVGIARALAPGAKLLLLDEAFGALDPVTRDALGQRLRGLHDELGLTTVLVTHDMAEALLLATRVVVMAAGRIVADETPAAMLPGGAATYAMDVRDRDAWAAMLADFTGETGLDVLFNNAGIAAGGPLAAMTGEAIDRVIAINLTAMIDGARLAYPYLKNRPGSCLLNTASAAGIYGSPGLATYAATKCAVRGLTEALDAEWAVDGIRVRALMPGFIDTPLLDATLAGSNRSARDGVVAAGLEFTPVERVAEAAWAAVHGERLLWPIGPTARRLAFAARWLPGRLRKRLRTGR
jgi:ABC-type nitrate/sulfonate/bicarbonate transport system ATPase subunit